MKKSLSLILALTLVFGLFANMAAAADAPALTTAEKYKWFVDAGILKGTPDGDGHLADNLTRAEFATIAVAVAGLTPATTGQTFSDVKKGQWWFGAIEAAAKAGLVNGTGLGKFTPNGKATVEEVIKVAVGIATLKPVAGATVAGASDWAAPYIQAAITAGLIAAGGDYKAAATRGQTFDIAYAVANATSKPVLSDVTAVLNAGDTVTVAGKVKGKTDSVKVKVGTADAVAATLNADGTFTYTTKKLSAGKYDIVVTGYNGTVAGTAVTANVEVKAFSVTSVTVLNATQVSIVLSKEADKTLAQNTSNYFENGTAVGASGTAVLSDDKKTVTLTFGSSHNNTSFTLGVKNLKTTDLTESLVDYSGTATVIDTVAPTVTKSEFVANGNLVITFSEPLQAGNPIVRVKGLPVAATATLGSATITILKTTLDAAGVSITGGEAAAIYVAGAKDTVGNEMALYNGSVTKGTDTVKPTVASVTQNGQNVIRIVFSEVLDAGATLDAGDLKFLKGIVLNPTASTVVADADGKTFDVTFAGLDIYGATPDATASVTLLIAADAVKDPYGNGILAFSQAFTFNADKTPPTFVSAAANAGKTLVNVTFNEAIGTATATKFVVTDSNGVRFVVNTAAITADTKVVALDFGAIADGTYTISLQAGAVADTQANAIVAVSTVVVVGTAGDTTKPVASLGANTPNKFVVDFTKEVGASALDAGNYKLDGLALPTGTVLYFTTTAKNQVAIELPAGSVAIGVQAGTAALLNVTGVADKAGNKNDSTNLSVKIADNTSAVLSSVQKLGNTLVLTFNENLDAATVGANLAAIVATYDIKVDGTSVVVGAGTATASLVVGDNKKVQIIFTSITGTNYDSSKVITVATKGANLKDANGFTAAAGTAVTAN